MKNYLQIENEELIYQNLLEDKETKKKLLALVQIADFLDCSAFSSCSDDRKIKTRPINGSVINIGSIGRLIIKKYKCIC